MSETQRRLLSEPVGVEWNGWQSDTRRLQQCGWQLAVERKPNDCSSSDSYRLAMKHEGLHLFAISNRTAFQREFFRNPWQSRQVPVFHVVQVLPLNFRLQTFGGVDLGNLNDFVPIDAMPQFVEVKSLEVKSLEDFNIFATISKTERIVIDKADMSVVEHLEAIKRMQAPKQRELRQKERQVNLIAQIVTEEAA